MSKAGSIRSFIAIDISDSLREALARLEASLKKSIPNCRWVPPDNIHITLKFLGDISESLADRIGDRMRDWSDGIEPYSLQPTHLGVFPGPHRPRVLWVGFRDVPEDHRHLVNRFERALRKLGFPRERKEPIPHLTLGRFRRPVLDTSLLSSLKPGDLPSFRVNRIVLYKSDLTPHGAVYQPLHIIYLSKEDV